MAHDYSITPDGWSDYGWARYLEHLADSCEAFDKERSDEYRRAAEKIRQRIDPVTAD